MTKSKKDYKGEIDRLLIGKLYEDLSEDERSIVHTQFPTKAEYSQARQLLINTKEAGINEAEIRPSGEVKDRLMQHFEQDEQYGWVGRLNSLFTLNLSPVQYRQRFQYAFLIIILLIGGTGIVLTLVDPANPGITTNEHQSNPTGSNRSKNSNTLRNNPAEEPIASNEPKETATNPETEAKTVSDEHQKPSESINAEENIVLNQDKFAERQRDTPSAANLQHETKQEPALAIVSEQEKVQTLDEEESYSDYDEQEGYAVRGTRKKKERSHTSRISQLLILQQTSY